MIYNSSTVYKVAVCIITSLIFISKIPAGRSMFRSTQELSLQPFIVI